MKRPKSFSQWSVAISSKKIIRYDAGHDHCEKSARYPSPFHNSSSCTQISLLRPRAATLPHDRATVSPFGLFFAVGNPRFSRVSRGYRSASQDECPRAERTILDAVRTEIKALRASSATVSSPGAWRIYRDAGGKPVAIAYCLEIGRAHEV